MPKEETQIAEKLDVLKELELGLGETTEEQVIEPEVEAPAPEEPAAEEPAVEPEAPGAEEAPKEEEPAKEPGVVEEPTPEPVAAESTTTEGDVDYKKRTGLLEEQLWRLSEQIAQQAVAQPLVAPAVEVPKEPAPQPVAAPVPAPAPADAYPFITEENYEQVIATPKALNQAMNAVYSRGVEANLRTMPVLVNKLIAQAFYVQTVRGQFYEQNEDLKRHAKYVGVVENEVRAKHPDLPMDQLFNKIAEEVRGQLGLDARKASAPVPAPRPNPTTVTKPTTSRKPPAQKLGDLEQEIDDLKNVQY